MYVDVYLRVALSLLVRDLTLKPARQSRYRAYVLEPKVTHILRTNIYFLETSLDGTATVL